MLLRLGEYIVNDVTTLYKSDNKILYLAEGTKQVKTLFINLLNYTGYMQLF